MRRFDHLQTAGDALAVESEASATYTPLVDLPQLERLETVRSTTCLFQKFLTKRFEIRVTVIGRSLFAAEIWPPQPVVDCPALGAGRTAAFGCGGLTVAFNSYQYLDNGDSGGPACQQRSNGS